MKLILISPPFGEKGQKSIVAPIAPPALEYLAGLTKKIRPDAEIELIDANREDIDTTRLSADMVGFTVHTVQAPWTYRTADLIRARNIPVVLGGIHVSALPEEAMPHADAVVVGEAESVWAQILTDMEKGTLKKLYHGERLPLNNLPHPETGLFKSKYVLGSFFTARGCPRRCRFCAVNKYFGGKVRLRPIPEVVAEIASSKRRLFWNLDDNCWGISVPRSIELYREMSVNISGKYWFGMGDLGSLDHPRSEELLKWARRSGMLYVRVGWETSNPATLEYFNAHVKQGRNRIDAIKKIRAAGIDVMLFVIVGSRQDTEKDFEQVIRLSEDLDIAVRPVMMTPLPETDLFPEYAPHLLPGQAWDRFDGYRAVFSHPTMTPAEREQWLTRLWNEMYTLPKILRRLTKIGLPGFPLTHLVSFMIQYSESKPFRQNPEVFPTGKKTNPDQ
ncbi:B12-binding domain-containing radical SAM protein [Thermincola potens]|uniref:Radical SAM domain protein n=1 Tax=Thermincola potens (strain JR) TaxID=635013 RepID=D5XD11_THEPJ|nr:radical SAM protein [Thermincola potens]ADG83687.1 Radical SAM domain protein [Thermincola potens JR]